ncbi:UdgX family uracil-DNA binding protein [Lentzea sp. BCCO 10_0798]|uniref:Type-4 uracil-DNA glycosylase n=1 Tax=Lentzea kristufekii TaxID=3095430 RepID=A0ABU4U1M8_9PSEU|nr:UdgX family uracil-DNA binding protein [Lentzea sp. BCCO 10_0798]MDX8054179.1 UdgX family uracil-DNA binding protein [Lentzea sp. BCCO 10_0798]
MPSARTSKSPGKAADGAQYVPDGADWAALRSASEGCRGCELYRDATQTVFGEGPVPARLMVVGECPGDREDTEGHVFVGPAGRLLNKAFDAAGIDRSKAYLTNAVKHFRFIERGKRRIHQQPRRSEVVACFPWLREEIRVVKPRLVIVLGAVAAKAVLGPSFKLTEHRGEVLDHDGLKVGVTVHPSSVVRAENFTEAFDAFVADLKAVRES